MDVTAITAGLTLVNKGLQTIKGLLGLLPDEKKTAISNELEQAEQNLKIGEAQIAQGLGYKICQCTWPPQIRLSIGRPSGLCTQYRCPACGDLDPPDPGTLPTQATTIWDPLE